MEEFRKGRGEFNQMVARNSGCSRKEGEGGTSGEEVAEWPGKISRGVRNSLGRWRWRWGSGNRAMEGIRLGG